jgi:hypothetical protein
VWIFKKIHQNEKPSVAVPTTETVLGVRVGRVGCTKQSVYNLESTADRSRVITNPLTFMVSKKEK